jgi:hypothetical protein
VKRTWWPDLRWVRALRSGLAHRVEGEWKRGQGGTEGKERADGVTKGAHTRRPTLDLDTGAWRDGRDGRDGRDSGRSFSRRSPAGYGNR